MTLSDFEEILHYILNQCFSVELIYHFHPNIYTITHSRRQGRIDAQVRYGSPHQSGGPLIGQRRENNVSELQLGSIEKNNLLLVVLDIVDRINL